MPATPLARVMAAPPVFHGLLKFSSVDERPEKGDQMEKSQAYELSYKTKTYLDRFFFFKWSQEIYSRE